MAVRLDTRGRGTCTVRALLHPVLESEWFAVVEQYLFYIHVYSCEWQSFWFVASCIVCRNLVPVTQLYVSVDASTKESLKKIDRPLFRDFWPRFISSLEALSDKVRYVHIHVFNER